MSKHSRTQRYPGTIPWKLPWDRNCRHCKLSTKGGECFGDQTVPKTACLIPIIQNLWLNCESHSILLTWLRSQQKDGSQNHEGKRTLEKPHSTAARLISQMTVTGSWPRARGKMQYNNKKGNTLKIWILQWFKFQSKTMFTLSEMSISSQMAIDSEGEIWHSILKTSSGSADV